MYSQLGAKVTTSYDIPAEHCWPTNDFGNACDYRGSPYLSNCAYNGAWAGLSTFYKHLHHPVNEIATNLFEFDQSEYTTPGDSLNSAAYMYVPTACQHGAKCRLHICFHGCGMTLADIGTTFIQNNEVNPIAEANNIIVLFPQIVRSPEVQNSDGCWDFYGYTEPDSIVPKETYPTKNGVQMKAVWEMARRIAGGKKFNVEIDFLSDGF